MRLSLLKKRTDNRSTAFVCVSVVWLMTVAANAENSFDLNQVYECDNRILCPETTPEELRESLERGMGFVIPVAEEGIERRELRVIKSNFLNRRGDSNRQRLHASSVTGTSGPGRDATGSLPLNQNPNHYQDQRNQRQGALQPNPQQQGAGGGAGWQNMQPQGGGISLGPGQVRAGGFLYSDDQDSRQASSSGKQQHNVVKNSVNPNIGNRNVAQNRQNRGLSSANSSGPSAREGFAAAPMGLEPQNLGPFESGSSPGEASDSSTRAGGSLQKIAKSLGLDRFFGGSGKGDFGQKRGSSAGLNQKGLGKNQKGQGSRQGKLVDPKTILQNKLNQYQKRNMANSHEFGEFNKSIFHSMCQHYIRYAHRHQMPRRLESSCPR